MRADIVDEVTVGAPEERAAQARTLVDRSGNIAAQLMELGFPPRDVLQACCAVTGVPPAPQGWLRDPKPPELEGLDGDLCRRLEAAPVAVQNGKLCVAYADPEIALRAADLGFPKHQPYLALQRDLQKALSLLPSPAPLDDPSNLFDGPLEDVDDGATLVNATVQFPNGAGASDEADDMLFDDATSSLAAPPSAPKPSRRQQTAAALASADGGAHDTLVNAPAGAAPKGAATVPPSRADADVATTPAMKRKVPSLATPSHGSLKTAVKTDAPSVSAPEAGTLAPNVEPAETLLTAGPPRMKSVRSGAPAGQVPASAQKAPPLARVSTEAHDKRALNMLSADDLIDDSEESDELPTQATEPSPSTEPPPPKKKETSSAPERDGTRAVTPTRTPSSSAPESEEPEGAFASSLSATNKEVVQSQKQRLKRIAQIASIKRYKIDRVLGRGGMATVYYATDTKTGKPCALKLMEPHLADDAVFVERFKREIRASTSLTHQNVVSVFDYGEENGTYYMASEYVDGGTVASLLKVADRPLPTALAVPLMVGFLDGLEHAHELGFVHRDLKPANLMLTTSGLLKIGDFGIAKAQTDSTLTKTGALFGTPAYMSPEQAQGQELDTRSDLFGVGIIFYELLSGYNPFAHENPSTTMFAIAKGYVRPLFDANPTVPGAVERVVHKLLEKDLKKRYQAAGQARDDLRSIGDLLAQKFPDAVARVVADPVRSMEALAQEQSRLESDRATRLLARRPPEHAEAAFRYYKATLLHADNYEAVNGLTQLRADFGFRFTRPEDRQMLELEQSLEKKPDQPAVLRRLADLSATHRNLVDMAGFMKRYLRYFPNDTHVLHKLERILGSDPLAPFSPMPVEIADKSAAFGADGDMLDAARIAADEDMAPTMTPSKPGMRAAARPGGAAARGQATPATATPPVNSDSSPGSRRAGGPPSRRPEPSATTAPSPSAPAEAAPPARDSLELLLRNVRAFFEDTVRSLTGDQGIAGMRESLKDRLDGGDLKGAVRGALGKGKEAVAEGLLKEEGRQAIKRTFAGSLRRHWRLAVVIIIGWAFLIGTGKLVSLACGAGDASVVAPPPAPVKQHRLDVVDDDDAAAPAPAPAPEREAAHGEAKLAPEDVERLLAHNKPAAPAPKDAKAALADQQEALKKKAKAAKDPKAAIALYTEAVDTDPFGPGARDALLERGRLSFKAGDLAAAEADVFRLKRRQDVGPIAGDVDALLADIEKAKKAQEPPAPAP